ncbi:RHS repeat-associated core domain-containing protein, partial [Microbulbifer thermotolerans]
GEVQGRTLTYLHTDHLNTPRIGTDGNEVVVWRWDSDAFGQTAPDTDPDSDGEQTVVNLRFPGQIQGGETTFYYNYFRDYDPSLGRCLTSDPIGLLGGPNTYAYVGGNPVKYIDPKGLDRWDINYASYRNGNYSAGYDFSGEDVEDPCGCGAKVLGIETATGATLVVSGLPVIHYPRIGVGTGSSTGATSIASRTLSSALSQRLPVRVPIPTVSNLGAGSRVLGRVLGRPIPYVGWGLLSNDAVQLADCLAECEEKGECSR